MSQKNPEIEKIKQELEKCEKEKEEGKRLKEIMEYAKQEMILKILPTLDNFNLACREVAQEDREKNGFIDGFLQIKSCFENFLKNEGLEEMNCLGETFDPYFHEAVEMIEDEKKESGTIVEEVQKGYKKNDKLIRPAKVKIVK